MSFDLISVECPHCHHLGPHEIVWDDEDDMDVRCGLCACVFHLGGS